MTEERVDIAKEFLEGTRIDEALRRAVRRALAEHKRAGNPIAVWRDGKLVLLPPEEIPDCNDDGQ